jgi:CRP-like cAMP-binding protein
MPIYLPLRKHFEKIIPLSDEEFEYVSSFFKPKKLRKHQFLVQEGEHVHHEYYVLKGCLKAYKLDINDREHVIQFAMEDWWITDFHAYFNRAPATLYVDCIEDSLLLSLSFSNREKLCREMHKMEHFFRMKLTTSFVALQQRILNSLISSTQQRYDQLIKTYPVLFQRVPKQDIASYLGVTRETLSRMTPTGR